MKNMTGDLMRDALKRGLFISQNSLSYVYGLAIRYDQ